MPLAHYGVLKGKAIEVRLGASQSPHYQVHLVDDSHDYRIAVNVLSAVSPSEVEYLVVDRFEHPLTATIDQLPLGFTPLPPSPTSGALDFIRGNLFDRSLMVPLPFNVPGPDNDLNDKIDRVMQRAMADEHAVVCAFGQRWGPETKKDKFFGFLPGNGIHDIHMNQGNVAQFVGDDGVWQDGGILVQFPDQHQWMAVFLRFQSQSWHTNDETGHTLGAVSPTTPTPPSPIPPEPVLPTTDDPFGLVRIVAALVNPVQSPEIERVTLLNRAPHVVDLTGWALLDTNRAPIPLVGTLDPGETRVVLVARPFALSNNGGTVSLLDEEKRKVDGVSYTKGQAKQPGWTIVF